MLKKCFEVFWFIIKCTFLGFGGGNALMPIIKKEAVIKRKWLTLDEFDKMVIATNSIPGPSVLESLSYISIKRLGKTWGVIIALLAIMPHLFLALGLFVISSKYLPKAYLKVIAISVMPVISGILIVFGYRYLKLSNKQIQKKPIWIFIFLLTLCFTLFIPAPYNIPAFVMVGVIVSVYVISRLNSKRSVQ